MADNTRVEVAGTGDDIATDDIAGIKHQRVKIEYGTDGNATEVSDSNPLPIDDAGGSLTVDVTPSVVDSNNSSTATLGIDAVYTGTGTDILAYAGVSVIVDSSHDSATDGMLFEFSTDDTNWDKIHTFTYVAADSARVFQFPVHSQYFRIVYTNGGTGQTTFRVQTILLQNTPVQTTHRLLDNVDPDRSVTVVKSAIIAQAAGSGDFVPLQATAGANIKVSVEEINGTAALPAGTNNIGDVDVVSSTLPTGAATAANQLADGHNVTVDNASGASAVNIQDGGNTITVDGAITADLGANNDVTATGNVAHDAVDSGSPVKTGAKAIAHGTNPTAVAAADRTDLYANRAGVPFVIGGHPNIVTVRANYTAAQTNAAIVTIGASLKIVVTRLSVTADNANTADVQARIGFAAATTPTTTGVVLSHPGIAAGSGIVEGNGSGILGVGADGEDLRITSEVPTTGSIDVVVSYYTVES